MARFWGVALLLVTAFTVVPANATVLSGKVRVVAAPSEGHPGGGLYLAGGGFPAHRLLAVLVACPNLRAPVNGVSGYPAVRTDGHGQFVAHRILAPIPRHGGAVRCAIYAGVNRASMARVVPAPFLIVPRSRPLTRCATHMCLAVTASLVRLRNGTQGNIVVAGWPGAAATVTVISAAGRHVSRRVRLHWQGTATVRLRISLGLKQAVTKRVTVTAHLGKVSGKASASFVVVPGGR